MSTNRIGFKTTELPPLSPAAGDLLAAVDVSDRTALTSGTNKKLTLGALSSYILAQVPVSVPVTLGTPNGLSLSGQALSLGLASAIAPGALTAADFVKLSSTSGTNTGDVTIDGASSTWLTRVGQVLKLTTVPAASNADGLVNQVAQTFSGVKTFANGVVMSSGLTITGAIVGDSGMTSSAGSSVFQITEGLMKGTRGTARWSLNEGGAGTAQLYNTTAGVEVLVNGLIIYGRGSSSTDVSVKLGTITTDAATDISAKLLSIGAGIYGTYVERAWFKKSGTDGCILGSSSGTITINSSIGIALGWSTVSLGVDGVSVTIAESGTQGPIFKVLSTAEVKMKGVDRTATIGADTQNKPSGINKIASGATTCRITNSLVPDPAVTKVKIFVTPHGNLGTWWVVQGNGYLELTLAVAAAADTSWSWQVNGLL